MNRPSETGTTIFDARQLAETIDTIGLLVASVSDRVDAQGRLLEKVHQTATEARAAAFAAEQATDWQRNGDLINQGIARGSRQVETMATIMGNQLDVVGDVFRLMQPLLEAMGPQERKRRERLERQRRWMPVLLAGAVVAGILLTLLGMHVVGRWQPVCGLLGGRHGYFTESGVEVCGFRQW
jgi:hypothetical protein